MRTLPTEPKPGDRISATLVRDIIRAIRERTIIQGPGVKVSPGPNGTVLSVAVQKAKAPEPADRLWHFTCEEDPESGERVGGWKNCKIQIGYSLAHMDETNKEKFSGFDQTEDGVYYIDVDLVNESVELKRVDFNDDESSSFEIPPSDLQNAHVNMEVGAVKDGVEAWSINWVPVIYKFI